jgi:hypothetical protein
MFMHKRYGISCFNKLFMAFQNFLWRAVGDIFCGTGVNRVGGENKHGGSF